MSFFNLKYQSKIHFTDEDADTQALIAIDITSLDDHPLQTRSIFNRMSIYYRQLTKGLIHKLQDNTTVRQRTYLIDIARGCTIIWS